MYWFLFLIRAVFCSPAKTGLRLGSAFNISRHKYLYEIVAACRAILPRFLLSRVWSLVYSRNGLSLRGVAESANCRYMPMLLLRSRYNRHAFGNHRSIQLHGWYRDYVNP